MILIVLPTYNEENNIKLLLNAIDESMKEALLEYKVILVNDGSTDQTEAMVKFMSEKLPIELINHPQNKGLGETIKTGLLHCTQICSDKDIIITMDADNTHTPGLILRLVRMIREGNEVVIASRYQPGAHVKGVPAFRKMLSKTASILFRLLFPITGVRDYTSGYRAYKANVLKKAFSHYGDEFVQESGFACMVDILLKLRRLNVVMNEAPLILRYDLKGSDSKMDIIHTIKNTLALMLRRIFRQR